MYLFIYFLFPIVDYQAPSYYSMIDNSDLIIHSKIIAQTDSTIQVEIIETLKCEWDSKQMTISKFYNWTCAHRYDDYEIGQEQIFMLKYDDYDHNYHVLSAGNHGEMPVFDGNIYVKSYISYGNKFGESLVGGRFLKFDFKESMIGIKRLIQKVKDYPSSETNCSFLDSKFKSNIENFVFEEQVLRGGYKHQCSKLKTMVFRIFNVVLLSDNIYVKLK